MPRISAVRPVVGACDPSVSRCDRPSGSEPEVPDFEFDRPAIGVNLPFKENRGLSDLGEGCSTAHAVGQAQEDAYRPKELDIAGLEDVCDEFPWVEDLRHSSRRPNADTPGHYRPAHAEFGRGAHCTGRDPNFAAVEPQRCAGRPNLLRCEDRTGGAYAERRCDRYADEESAGGYRKKGQGNDGRSRTGAVGCRQNDRGGRTCDFASRFGALCHSSVRLVLLCDADKTLDAQSGGYANATAA